MMEVESDVDKKIQKIIMGPQIGGLLYTVLDINIPKLLESGSKTVEQLAQETQTIPDKLERILLNLET